MRVMTASVPYQQVIELVLENAGLPSLQLELKLLSVLIEGFHFDHQSSLQARDNNQSHRKGLTICIAFSTAGLDIRLRIA